MGRKKSFFKENIYLYDIVLKTETVDMKKTLNDICAAYTLADEVKGMGIYPYYRPISSGQNPIVRMADGSDVLMFGSNSYLGLSDDPRLKEAAIKATEKYGSSCSGSRFLNGTLDIHQELEEKLARFVGKEEAVTYSTGFQVNLGVVSSLGFHGGYTFLDSLDHACIIDGSRLGFSQVRKFPHNDMQGLEKKLRAVPRGAYKFIVVDGIYSMEGDIAKLPEIVALCKKYNASVMVDDAHALGVIGENGSGKSTLIKGILGLKSAADGKITRGDGLKASETGYLPQQTPAQKDFPASVYEVVLSGRLNSKGLKPFYSKTDKKIARDNIKRLNIEHLEKRSYRDLSGGQQQRVLLARALCASKKLLLLDEPVTGLDPIVTEDMYKLIEKLFVCYL